MLYVVIALGAAALAIGLTACSSTDTQSVNRPNRPQGYSEQWIESELDKTFGITPEDQTTEDAWGEELRWMEEALSIGQVFYTEQLALAEATGSGEAITAIVQCEDSYEKLSRLLDSDGLTYTGTNPRVQEIVDASWNAWNANLLGMEYCAEGDFDSAITFTNLGTEYTQEASTLMEDYTKELEAFIN